MMVRYLCMVGEQKHKNYIPKSYISEVARSLLRHPKIIAKEAIISPQLIITETCFVGELW